VDIAAGPKAFRGIRGEQVCRSMGHGGGGRNNGKKQHGNLIRQVYLDGDLVGGSNSFGWNAPLFSLISSKNGRKRTGFRCLKMRG
jgi:hypothetical protein